MKPLNLCREMTPTLQYAAENHESRQIRDDAAALVGLAKRATKFVLPDGGRTLVDPALRGLSGCEAVRLPFEVIALEYLAHGQKIVNIAFESDGWIYLRSAWQLPLDKGWSPSQVVGFPQDEWWRLTKDGLAAYSAHFEERTGIPCEIAAEMFASLLGFVNALACSNVSTESVSPSSLRQNIAKDRGALPYDTYHFLTVEVPARTPKNQLQGGEHRSPREHLRRGHIRRLGDGRRIWVNAAIVSAGNGGRVLKDYGLNPTSSPDHPH